jgi:hypothetical protein
LPRNSRGAAGAVFMERGAEGTFFAILTPKDAKGGLFSVHDDTHFHFTYRMDKPNWINVFLIGGNADGSHSSNYLFNDLRFWQSRPGQWLTVSIPISHFKRLTADGREPWQGDLPKRVLFSAPGADRGLVIDRMWVTRGGPGFVQYSRVE